jgi:glycosyltransferase involved in cell wall biosynthesis
MIVLNPSLGKTALKRDALFLKIAKWFRKKVVVFFHGWDHMLANAISKEPEKFRIMFQKADAFIVLASSFEKQLLNWGIRKPIYISTTKFYNSLIKDFKIEAKNYNQTLLFLARVEEKKGILLTLESVKLLQKDYPNIKLQVAGDGSALKKAREYVKKNDIKGVTFFGNIQGEKLIDTFYSSDIYVLPTSHGEGMPTSVLEAMAFGLPVITRPVGGLVDFFENGKMGWMIDSLEPSEFVRPLEELLANPKKMNEMGSSNHEYAKKHFMASKVALEIENMLRNV